MNIGKKRMLSEILNGKLLESKAAPPTESMETKQKVVNAF